MEKSTDDAIFQNWRAAGETSRLFRDPPPFCFSRSRAPTVSVSSGLLRIKRATSSKSTLQAVIVAVFSTLIFRAIFLTFNGRARWLNFSSK